MLRFIRSDCTDRLADALIDTLAAQPLAPTPDALEPEWIVVPSAAVARYVQQRIARRFGIAADVQFTYPAATLWALAARVVPGIAAESPFDPSSLTWRIYALLDVLERGDASDAALAPLATYLDRTRDDPVARMQLAQALAELFDRYTTFRSDVWLAPWARGELAAGPQLDAPTQAWQAALWRHIVAGLGLGQAPHPLERFRAALARDPRVREALPRRVRLFAVHALAPLYWQTYAALAEAIDVEIYHREPSAEYYGDLLPERRIAALRAQANPLADVAESGNDVLASWGRQAIEQLDLAIATGAWDASEERHARRMGTSLLARVQRSVVELDPRPDLAPALDDAHDRSLVIHACTSLQRQLEALHDDLLARLDADPTLAPDDIAVFVPDIDAAAPMIDAVFGAMPAAIRLPYRMTGRAQPQADPLVAAFLALLDLPRARFSAEAVAALLRVPACARRFGLDADAVERVVALVADAGARWALDAHDRARHGVPAQGRHTWTYALERLVLGA
ncbi:MAG TPA: exodeoxyribonuclease V subunit gamma, partial [Burkholderiaceae bacterium]|nr:exodeoxyribonuclease V subunit gamma [Burkholderiaceae bacterium]